MKIHGAGRDAGSFVIMEPMKQIFILGASGVYGVGSKSDGWGGLVKSHVHSKIYGDGGAGEVCEVFNFAKSGSTVEFWLETASTVFDNYSRGGEVLTIVSIGGNDARASDEPENYVCSTEEFREKIQKLLATLKERSDQVIFVANGLMDESKVNPKISPFSGRASYFTNERRSLFNDISREVCEEIGLEFVANKVDKDVWVKEYLYEDGLHPNEDGYKKVFEGIVPYVDEFFGS